LPCSEIKSSDLRPDGKAVLGVFFGLLTLQLCQIPAKAAFGVQIRQVRRFSGCASKHSHETRSGVCLLASKQGVTIMKIELPKAIIPESVKALLGIKSEDVAGFNLDPEFSTQLPEQHLSWDGFDFKWVDSGMDIRGSASHDRVFATEYNDRIAAGDGDDVVAGRSGDDQISGDAGNDRLYGDDGRDMLWGGSGDDMLQGGEGHDRLFGGSGDDMLNGEQGLDTLYGGSGNDQLFGDTIAGGSSGADLLDGGVGYDIANYWSHISDASWFTDVRPDGLRVTHVTVKLADGSYETDMLINIEQINFGLCDTVLL
jgi:hypothetical protein